MQFQPRITEIDDNKLQDYVEESRKVYDLSSIAGRMVGAKLRPEWHKLYDEATSPELITVEN